MNDGVLELYPYDRLRGLAVATAFVRSVDRPTLVLGSRQSAQLLSRDAFTDCDVRRRRGGGGVVLLRPGDVWVDWWIPATDPRYCADPLAAAIQAGGWWRDALGHIGVGSFGVVSRRRVEPSALAVACFATLGAGEVTYEGHKLVGLTQWRVREGGFISTAALRTPSTPLVAWLFHPPAALGPTLAHESLDHLGLSTEVVVAALDRVVGPWASPPPDFPLL